MAIPQPRMRALSALSTALAVFTFTADAHAAGFYLSDTGARGLARAGAFVAAPDSLLALHYNPAGLSYLRGLQVEASLSPVIMDVQFQRKCPCVMDRTDAARADMLDAELEASFAGNPSETNTTLYIPFLAAGYGFDWQETTVAIGIWGPNSGRHNYGELPPATRPTFADEAAGMPNRYSGIEMKTIEVNFGIGVGSRPFKGIAVLDRLRVGAMLMGFQSGNDQTVHLWLNSETLADIYGRNPENPQLDVPIAFNFLESFGINWSVGANFELYEGLTLGASFRGQRNIKTSGTIDVSLPGDLLGDLRDPDDDVARVTGNAVDVELKTAPIFRTGIEYNWPNLFRAELAWVWEGWSAHDEVVITPKDIQFEITGQDAMELGVIRAQRGWRDTWSLRFGGEFTRLAPYVVLMGGYLYEPSAIGPERVDPSRIDLDKHAFSLGAATTWYGVTFTTAFQYTHLVSTTVTTSEQVQITALDGTPELLTNIGNGDYSGRYFTLSFGLTFALDPLLASK